MSLDAVVVLGGGVSPDGELSAWSRERLAVALELVDRGLALNLIVSGGWALTEPRPPRLEAEVMADRAAERMDADRIRMEQRSRDTIGNAWFVREIIEEEGWTRLCCVTSDFHVPRASWIFRRVMPGVTCTWVPAPSGLMGAELLRTLTQEAVLHTFLQEWMRGVEPGDDEALRRFIGRHPGYSDRPTLERTDIEERLEAIRRELGVER